jgi:UDP-4-amino-4,6-dideoxy-N-acetyl-beta-L-altrosamine N-acetyltransferase
MIIIECENVQLQLISPSDLEMIREWRNQPHVVEHMEYQESITPKQQMDWYTNLGKQNNLYFKIQVSEVPIGIIHLKELNWKDKTAEAGIFIGRKDFIGTITPMISILVLMKTAFRCLSIQTLYAKISRQNGNALSFNLQLGYELEGRINENFDRYICTKNRFFSPNSSVSKIQQLFKQHAGINIYLDDKDEWLLEHLTVDDRTFHLRRI